MVKHDEVVGEGKKRCNLLFYSCHWIVSVLNTSRNYWIITADERLLESQSDTVAKQAAAAIRKKYGSHQSQTEAN